MTPPTSSHRSVRILALAFIIAASFVFAPQAFAGVLAPGNISTCGELAAPGTYTLTTNVAHNGVCFLISSDGVNIVGGGHTVTGNSDGSYAVDASGVNDGDSAYTNLTISNIVFANFSHGVNAIGHDGSAYDSVSETTGDAGDGGSVTITNSTLPDVTTNGGNGLDADSSGGNAEQRGAGGAAGDISLTNSTTTGALAALGGVGGSGSGGVLGGMGGDGGQITLTNSSVGDTLSTTGGVGGDGDNTAGAGGAGGGVTLTNSSSGDITTEGGATGSNSVNTPGNGGAAGAVSISNSTAGNIITTGGNGYYTSSGIGSDPGSSGSVTVATSTVGDITASAGEGFNAGAIGGTVTIAHSIVGNVYSSGGDGGYSGDNGGDGGSVSITASSSVTSVTTNGGTSLYNYGGDGGSISITNSNLSGVSLTSLGADASSNGGNGGSITITASSSLDVSSTTISVVGGSTQNPTYSSNGTPGTLSATYNGALITSGAVVSPLSSFSENGTQFGAYGGGGWPLIPGNISSCGTLSFAGTYTLTGDLTGITGACFTITSDNVIIDGAGHTVTGNNTGAAVNANASGYGQSAYTGIGINSITFDNFNSGFNAIGGSDTDDGNVTNPGAGGSVTIASSTLGNINVDGGNMAGFQFWGGTSADSYGGSVSVSNSAVGNIYATPGDTNGGVSGSGGSVTLASSTALYIVVNGGYGDSGGSITVASSTVETLSSEGGADPESVNSSLQGVAGNGGTISIINSVFTTADVSGASAAYNQAYNYGGNGGSISISSPGSLDLSNTNIVAPGGVNGPGTAGNGMNGTAQITYTGTFTHTNTILSALSDLTITGNGTVMDYGAIAGGFLPGTINSCGLLSLAGTYILGSDFGNNSSCLTVDGYNIVIDGAGHTLSGTVNGAGAEEITDFNNQPLKAATAASSFTLQNITVTGSVLDDGGAGIDGGYYYSAYDDGTNAGYLTIASSTIEGGVRASGGVSVGGVGGGGGTVTVSNSTVGDGVYANGSANGTNSYSTTNQGGTVAIVNSSITGTVSAAGGTSIASYNISGGSGGSITLTNSPVSGNIIAYGGTGISSGGNGGSISISATGVLNLSNPIIRADGGETNPGNNQTPGDPSYPRATDGTLNLSYAGLNVSTSTIFLSTLSDFVTNGIDKGAYPVSPISPVVLFDSFSNSSFPGAPYNPPIYYYNNATGDGNWNNVLNWWLDPAFTIQAQHVPISYDDVIISGNLTQDTSNVAAAGSATFVGNATNHINITVTNGATFTASSSNAGNINGTSTYIGDTTNDLGNVAGQEEETVWLAQSASGYRYWTSITSSSDGSKLAATNGSNGYIYTSTDYGVTWTQQTSSGRHYWTSITSSSDGTKLAATSQNNGYVYTSTTSGATWVQQTSSGQNQWLSITSSSDGTKLAAVGISGYIYTSTTSGATWVQQTSSGQNQWLSITSSSDGTKLAAAGETGYIYTSTTSGATWVAHYSNAGFVSSITSSSDGTKLAATSQNNGYVYTSTTSGATWVQQTSSGQRYWSSITSSSDGSKLAATDGNGYIYTSADYGATWVQQTSSGSRNWTSITSSSDGTKLAAAGETGYIYTYPNLVQNTSTHIRQFISDVTTVRNFITEGGINTWIVQAIGAVVNLANATYSAVTNTFQAIANGSFISNSAINGGAAVVPSVTINSPTAATIIKWLPSVTWDAGAATCEYKMDDGSYAGLDCTAGGADIPRPTAGAHILYVRATDASGNTSEKTVSFTYNNVLPVDTDCSAPLDEPTRQYYFLTGTTTATCTITANNTTLRGNGYTLIGGVSGNATSTGTGLTFTLSNISVTGDITSNGADGQAGGTINLNLASTTNVYANGGDSAGNAGNGGTINATTSMSVNLTADGGNSTVNGRGGNGGTVNTVNSIYAGVFTLAGSNGPSYGGGGGNPSGGQHLDTPNLPSSPSGGGGTSNSSSGGVPGGSSGGGDTTLGSPVGGGALPSLTLPVNQIGQLNLTPLPTFGDTTSSSSFSFLPPLSQFLFSPLPDPLGSALAADPTLQAFMSKLGLTYSQNLVALQTKPIAIPSSSLNSASPIGIYFVSLKGKAVATSFAADPRYDVVQLVHAAAGTNLLVSLIPEFATTTARLDGHPATFATSTVSGTTTDSIMIIVPSVPGRYYLTTPASPLALAFEVQATSTVSTPSTPVSGFFSSLWSGIKNFFLSIIHFFTP